MELREQIKSRKFGRKMNPNNLHPTAGFFLFLNMRLDSGYKYG